jgi:predicted metalloprotease with PDZ domain
LGRNHWKLDRPTGGRVTLDYVIDLGLFAAAAWSSPLESGIVEAKNGEEGDMAVHARSLFIDAGVDGPAEVVFVVPAPWRPVAPWSRDFRGRYLAPSTADLQDNMLAFTTRPPLIARASGFTVQIVAMGHWRPLEALLKASLERIVAAETRLMGWRGREIYNVVLVPVADTGGESYRQSFAYCFDGPTADNRAQWANTLAHELFHYWNASRLKGADYPSSQWFQEGFTEYAANLVLLSGAIARPQAFLARLSGHIANAARLETSMENIGNRKGPPLYSSGALVAFSWDVAIRNASGGRRDLGHFFRYLWRATNGGERPYAWPDIRLALEATAPGDWEGFHTRHLAGREPLPLDGTIAKAGLRRVGTDIRIDADAPAQASAVWRSLAGG